MEKQGTNYSEWVDSLTVGDVVNMLTLTVFTAIIIVFVVRTFRNKPSA